VIAVLVVALGVAAGFAIGRATSTDHVTTTTTLTQQVADPTLPPAVARTRTRLLRAAESHDYALLRRIIGTHPIRYTFGADVPGGPVAFWKRAEAHGGKPIETLAAILKLPYTLAHGIYWWPFAYTTPPGELTPYEVRLLSDYATPADVAKWKSFGGYFGYRAGIGADGVWQIYVSGD
jgi:hypothetical protein